MKRNDYEATGNALPSQEREQVLDSGVRGLQLAPENPRDSLRGDRRKDLGAQEYRQSEDETMSVWLDDGGESGEVV